MSENTKGLIHLSYTQSFKDFFSVSSAYKPKCLMLKLKDPYFRCIGTSDFIKTQKKDDLHAGNEKLKQQWYLYQKPSGNNRSEGFNQKTSNKHCFNGLDLRPLN